MEISIPGGKCDLIRPWNRNGNLYAFCIVSTLMTCSRDSPRNLSLPANRLFFFPPNFQAENLIPGSCRASSETSSWSTYRSRTPSPCCVSPLPTWHGATYRRDTLTARSVSNFRHSTPLPRRNINKIITKDSSERLRKLSISEVNTYILVQISSEWASKSRIFHVICYV